MQIDQPTSLETTQDQLLGGRLTVIQPKNGFRVAIDSLLLAAAVPAESGQKLAELGCGVGTVSLAILARLGGEGIRSSILGVEKNELMAGLARENAKINGQQGAFRILNSDLKQLPPAVEPVSFDHVFMNPPYLKPENSRASPNPLTASANSEGDTSLQDWVIQALKLLRPKGRLTLIHRTDRLPEILEALSRQAGSLRLLPIWPRSDQASKRVLVQVTKGAKGPLELLPGLILHDHEGGYSKAAHAVLMDAEAISWKAQ